MSLSLFLRQQMLRSQLEDRTLYVSLHSGDPGEDGDNELLGISYRRQEATFGLDFESELNQDVVSFIGLPAGLVTHTAIWDTRTGGNFLSGGPLDFPREVEVAGDGIFFRPRQIRISLLAGE